MPPTFTTDPDLLHGLVSEDHAQSAALLEELGGVEGLATRLHTNLSQGISEEEQRPTSAAAAARVARYGRNQLPEAEAVTFWDLVWESLEDRMMQILIVSAVISLVLGLTVPDQTTGEVDYQHGWVEGAAILLSVTLVTLVSSLNNYQKELKFRELTKATPPVQVSVVRGGRTVETTDRELLVGDLLSVSGGDVLSVDGVVLRSASLKVDESAATGENDDVAKTSRGDNILRSGSNVVEGEGTVLVTAVGVHSFAGRIAMQVREAKDETPLQEKLTELADLIGYFGMAAAGLMFTILSLKELYDTFVQHAHPFYYKKYLDNLTTAVTIVVVAVPEGLPLSVTIALAYSMKQMFRENNLVRHLVACETMGGATTICTDKTGTITQNKMTVTDGVTSYGARFHVPVSQDEELELNGTAARGAHFTQVLDHHRPSLLYRMLLESISLNTKSTRKHVEIAKTQETALVFTGSKTEQALLNFVDRLGQDPIALRLETLQRVRDATTLRPVSPFSTVQSSWSSTAVEAAATFSKEMHVYPFTSARKRMTTAMVLPQENVVRYHVKGASEIVLRECSHTIDAAGVRVEMASKTRQELEASILSLSSHRLRTLAIAYAELPIPATTDGRDGDGEVAGEFRPDDSELPGLTLLAIIAIRDPVRPEVPRAIAQCRRSGVLVRMITGDNCATAVSIAEEVGIYGKVWHGPAAGQRGTVLEGPAFREVAKDEQALDRLLPSLQVIARASPLDKQILVAALMKRGEVVAVTGDGTNDAPALRNAHVGFSMNSGTEVAKKASDVIILDNNFSTIVTAIKWGRNVGDNISKFLQFQMTVNVAAVVVSFIGALLDDAGESPLKPVQLLWLNLIMDTLAALALATETPTEKVLERPPHPKEAPLISRRMWVNILGQSIYQIILQLWLLHGGYRYLGVEPGSASHLTVVFNIFVLLQLCNEFNARLLDRSLNILKGLHHAPLFLLVVGTTFVVQLVGVQYGGAVMHTVPLSAELWRQCFLFSVAPLPLGALLRLLPVKEAAPPPARAPRSSESEDSEMEGEKEENKKKQ